ncbi:MAG: hypothetical protein WEC37_02910 [Anaerolineales bacterium]
MAKNQGMNRFYIWATILLGVAFLLGGLTTMYLALHQRNHIIVELRDEKLEVADPQILLTYESGRAPEGVEVPNVLIDTATEADAQARLIRVHTMSSTGGLTYAEMDREDPGRALYITSLTLQTTLHQAHLGLELTLFITGVGLAFTGIGAGTLVIGLPLVRKVFV